MARQRPRGQRQRPIAARATRPKKRRTASRPRRSATRAREAARKRSFEIFDRQIDALWTRFTSECRLFAQGFNQEIGADQLRIEENPAGLLVRFTADGAEVFFQLDRADRHIACVMTSGCTSFGSCITEHAPLGLTIVDAQLRFVYGGSPVSEEDLAVRVLTSLVESGSPAATGQS